MKGLNLRFNLMLHPDRYFSPDPGIRKLARALYEEVAKLPLVCPHGHVDPQLLADNPAFPDPTELIIIPDHYVFRMLYSQGVQLEDLGIKRKDGGPVETDHRKIWQTFGDHFHLFRGTPTNAWIRHEFEEVFEIQERLSSKSASRIYDQIQEKLNQPEFRPRALFENFKIEVLCTTDGATDDLKWHKKIIDSDWNGRVCPTFRPDAVINFDHPQWSTEIVKLGEITGSEIKDYKTYIQALESRRAFFKEMGATATDHAALTPLTLELSESQAEALLQKGLKGEATAEEAAQFTAHMFVEMARMSVDDGLVMQLHVGSFRNHNQTLFDTFGPDTGHDIPIQTEYTQNLRALLNKYGNDPRFTLVLFTLDESTYSRELAPLAGHYPALRLGPPWWFHDSVEGMRRFRRQATETAGIYNTAGFNDDTRAFPSIPARHDVCRRVDAGFLAEMVAEHVIDEDEAREMIIDLSYNLVKQTYKL